MLNFNICKISKPIISSNDGKSIFMEKFPDHITNDAESMEVIDEDNICLTNLFQLILTTIACLLMLFTGLYKYCRNKKFFSRYNRPDEFNDHQCNHYNEKHYLHDDTSVSSQADPIVVGDRRSNELHKDDENIKKNLPNNCGINSKKNSINTNRGSYSSTTSSATTSITTDSIHTLFKLHNIRCACELILLGINSLEICKSLLPLPFYAVTFWSGDIINAELPVLSPPLINTNINNYNLDKFQLILYSAPFVIPNSVLSIFTTLILIGYHRILEMQNIPELLYLSLPLEVILAILRIYQIHSNVPSYFDLEPFLNWSTALCLFLLALIDGYVLYKQRFKLKRVNKKLNEEKIGYKHSVSTFFSKILFWWLNSFLWRGYREPLEQEDLGRLREEDSARAYYDQFLLIYKTSAKENKNPSLWLCYLKSSWKWFTLGGILKLFGDLSALIGPLSIHQIVDYIEYEYNRFYLNRTSFVYNIQNQFIDERESIHQSNNNSINSNNSNYFGNNSSISNTRMNLFTRTNFNIIWSLLHSHSNSYHRKLNSIIESHDDNAVKFDAIKSLKNMTTLSSLGQFDVADNANSTENKWNEMFDHSTNGNTQNISSSLFLDQRMESGHQDIIHPLYSLVNSISQIFQLPSWTGLNLWANISWISDEQLKFSDYGKIATNTTGSMNFDLGGVNGGENYLRNNQHNFYHYHYYYYPNWSEFLSNGWIIAWIVLLSAIVQGGLSQASTHLLNMTGIRIKTSLQGLIYRKTLLLSSSCIETNMMVNNCNSSNCGGSDISERFHPSGTLKGNKESSKMFESQVNNNKIDDNNLDNSSEKRKLSQEINNESVKSKKYSMEFNSPGNQKRDAGSITNLMTEDSLNIMSFFMIAHYVWAIPLKIGFVMYLLYLKLGVSAIIGSLVCIITMTPLQFLIGKAMSKNSEISAQCTDERLRKISDIFLGIKLIKLNAWEKVYRDKIAAVRKKELKYLNKDSFYWTVMTFLTHLSSVLITFVTLSVYVRLETGGDTKQSFNGTNSEQQNSMFGSFGFEFTASRLFSALALFNQLTVPLLIFPITVPIIISAIVSTKRIERFLREPEVQKEFEGIKHMARILSKSDAALDMYEIKKPTQQPKEEKQQQQNGKIETTNFSIPISPIQESESSIEFLSPQICPSNNFEMPESTETQTYRISDNEIDIINCKQNIPLSSKKTESDSVVGYYASKMNNNNQDGDLEKSFCDLNRNSEGNRTKLLLFKTQPTKSVCDELDREYNEIDKFDMENKSLTEFLPSNGQSGTRIPQQCLNINNNNNNSNVNYYNDCHDNGNNKNINNNNNCYGGKNEDIKENLFTAIEHNDEQQKKILKETQQKQQNKKEIDINSKEKETIQTTDSPRTSINTKLKRECKSHTLPKKKRNKDLIRGRGGGEGGGGGNTAKKSVDGGSNNRSSRSISRNFNFENLKIRNNKQTPKTMKNSDSNQNEVGNGTTTMREEILSNELTVVTNGKNNNSTGVCNSRKLISGRESFQFQIVENTAVSISDGVFSWDNCNASLRIDELNIPKGKLTIVVGKNASGKTSLISALLKEMHKISGEVSWNKYSTIAYVPQQPWLLNASIRDNILFGESYRPKRYEKVLEACALKPDIDLMPEGDMTLIGERGINLSGGQKQRINIARSLYSSANVIMMDDPLSALDNEVAKHVFEHSIKKMLLKANRTVILVTQKLQLLSSANYLIVMKDCCVQSAGSYEQIQKNNPEIVLEWNSILAKGYDRDQISPGKTARERWRLFKNISRIGLLRPQDTEQEHLMSTQSLYMQTKRRSSIFGSRHLIYDIPLPIDECQNDDIIIKRRGSRRSILLMGLGNAISGTNMVNCDLRQHDGNVTTGIRRKNSVLRVKSLQSEEKTTMNRPPVVRNISSPGRFPDTKNRISDSEFKPKTGFRQFLNRMSSRRSNLGTKLHRPLSASNSIQSISEESHANLQKVESSCSSDFIDDESVLDGNNEANENAVISQIDDERKYGEIPLQIYMLYLKSCGLPIVLTFFITALIWQCLRVYTDVWLRYWTEMDFGVTTEMPRAYYATDLNSNSDINNSVNGFDNGYSGYSGTSIFTEQYQKEQQQQQHQKQQQYDISYCFNMYTIISSICILMSVISIPAGQKAGCNAREKLHDQLLESLFAKPLHFFQITPLGKIINRFSNDMAIIDKKIAPTSQRLLQFTLLCLCAVLINLAITPWFIVLTIPICFAYYVIQKFYRCSSRELQRLENITSSPVISHFNETIQGVTTIRAYNQESRFTETLFRRLEANTIAFVMLNTSNRWLGIALDYLGGIIVFVAIVTALLAASIAKAHQKLYNEINENFHSHDRYYNNNNNQYSSSYSTSSNSSILNLNNSTPSLLPLLSTSTSSSSSGMDSGINWGYVNSNNENLNIYYHHSQESSSIISALSPSPSLVGLAINYTLLVPIYLNWVVKLLSDMEMYVGSVERIAYYQEKLYENFCFWKNSKYSLEMNRNNYYCRHCQHNGENEENNDQKQHQHNCCCNCQKQLDDEMLYCEQKSKKVLSCRKCDKIIPTKEMRTEMPRKKTSRDTDAVLYSVVGGDDDDGGGSCCHEHEIPASDDLKQIVYNTVPISWPQKGDIEFVNVTLRYQGQQQNIITDLSLKIPAGQKIGICGRTGSGKSTLALSLFSVMEIIAGKILIDGININSIHPDEVRSRLSIIPQDVHLFNATIRENLDPRGHYSDLELWNCLEIAQLKEIVTRMPQGLDTEIIEGGFNLSAGQRQLFCLARAVLRGSVCLILDEATSSLDAITEKALMDAAHNAFKGRTILTIAHRLSTLLTYDRVIVLENGKIIEDGTPNELKTILNGKFLTMLQSAQ